MWLVIPHRVQRAQKVCGTFTVWKGSLNSMLAGRLEFKPAMKAV